MKVVMLVAMVVVSVAVQATAARVFDLTFANIDLPLVVVVLASLSGGPIVGLWVGTLAGFLQDVMSGGLIGVSGLAKSLIGVTVGLLATRLMFTGRWYQLLLIVPATIMNVVLFVGVYRLISFAAPAVDGVNVLQQAVLNVAAGFVGIGVSEQVPGLWSRLRRRRLVLAIQRWRTN
jgi:rod shape-determining protein MreD